MYRLIVVNFRPDYDLLSVEYNSVIKTLVLQFWHSSSENHTIDLRNVLYCRFVTMIIALFHMILIQIDGNMAKEWSKSHDSNEIMNHKNIYYLILPAGLLQSLRVFSLKALSNLPQVTLINFISLLT